MSKELLKANEYIEKNKEKVKDRPLYHFTAPVGWLNDPNGFSYFKGEYHLFYQHYPYANRWGRMHWGHAVTTDFVNWEHKPVALAPDKPYDSFLGCFSGTAMVKDDALTLMYTGVNKAFQQQQCVAESTDGVNFEKNTANPVIPCGLLPSTVESRHFRDPKLFERDGKYYAIVGAKENIDGAKRGQILLFSSPDTLKWEYKGRLFENTITEGTLECPDIFRADGTDALICSPQRLAKNGIRFQNLSSSVYMLGKLDLENGKFTYGNMEEFDGGFDFYAPQTVKAKDGRVIMTAWLNMWGGRYPTKKEGWVGSFILPRELTVKNGRIIQTPVKEIEGCRKGGVTYKDIRVSDGDNVSLDGIRGNVCELLLTVDTAKAQIFGIGLFKGKKTETRLYYDKREGIVVLDRKNSSKKNCYRKDFIRKTAVDAPSGVLSLRIFLDKFSVEAFIQDGEKTMSASLYPEKDAAGIEFYAEGEAVINQIIKYDLTR